MKRNPCRLAKDRIASDTRTTPRETQTKSRTRKSPVAGRIRARPRRTWRTTVFIIGLATPIRRRFLRGPLRSAVVSPIGPAWGRRPPRGRKRGASPARPRGRTEKARIVQGRFLAGVRAAPGGAGPERAPRARRAGFGSRIGRNIEGAGAGEDPAEAPGSASPQARRTLWGALAFFDRRPGPSASLRPPRRSYLRTESSAHDAAHGLPCKLEGKAKARRSPAGLRVCVRCLEFAPPTPSGA